MSAAAGAASLRSTPSLVSTPLASEVDSNHLVPVSQGTAMRAIAAAALFAPCVAVCGGAPAGPASAIPADAGVTPGPRQTCEQLRSAVEFIVFDLVAEHASGCLRDD